MKRSVRYSWPCPTPRRTLSTAGSMSVSAALVLEDVSANGCLHDWFAGARGRRSGACRMAVGATRKRAEARGPDRVLMRASAVGSPQIGPLPRRQRARCSAAPAHRNGLVVPCVFYPPIPRCGSCCSTSRASFRSSVASSPTRFSFMRLEIDGYGERRERDAALVVQRVTDRTHARETRASRVRRSRASARVSLERPGSLASARIRAGAPCCSRRRASLPPPTGRIESRGCPCPRRAGAHTDFQRKRLDRKRAFLTIEAYGVEAAALREEYGVTGRLCDAKPSPGEGISRRL